jgi:hypothetical protein
MTKSITKLRHDVEGTRRVAYADLDITGYTASGEPLTAKDFGLAALDPDSGIDILEPLTDESRSWRWDGSKIRALGFAGPHTQTFPDIKGGENANQATGSNTTDPVNGAFVHALAAVTTGVVNTGITNPDFPRNLVVQLRSAGGGTLPANCGNVTLIGTDQFGAAVTETLSLAALNSVVLSAGGEVWVVGTKVFKTLTSYQFSVDLAASVADINGSVGIGTRLGLLAPITAEADIKAVQKNTAAVAAANYDGSATTHSVLMGANLADNDEVYITFDPAKGEYPAGVDVGKARVKARGW